ncbi:MAG: CehA/McbA family metallohydrolase [Deltaproteobacteria bacterium]|nr:CehA/McbA family metallohydrolase [Deltaproteobacteria bacterium]
MRTFLLWLLGWGLIACSETPATLEIRVVDESGQPTPARLELLDEAGQSHIADDGLRVKTECFTTPLPDWASSLVTARSIDNPYTGTTQFYADGTARASLPPGRYRARASKGIEYRVASGVIDLGAGASDRLELVLERWIDMPAQGWFSSDDHLHITRLTAEDDALIGKWMRAEDLHVANLLRMGTQEHFGITPQYAFGDDGAYRDGSSLVLAGQEHPRTHVLGHTITLGAEAAIDRRDSYAIYQGFWQESRRLGGASGYAHLGTGHAREGLAIDAPTGLLSFLEVLQFDIAWYEVLYELLNLGVRIAPSAGTDFPCIPSIPGRERFYTRVGEVGGELPTRASWIAGVRAGHTFATNGPLLELEIGGVGIGHELHLDGPRDVRVHGRVRFDPARDDVQRLELVRGGEVVAVAGERVAPGEIRLDAKMRVPESTWLALRASGEKIGELPLVTTKWFRPENLDIGCRLGCGASMYERAEYVGAGRTRPSLAHTAPIYVRVGDRAIRPAPELLRAWIARLDAFEAQLADDRLEELVVYRPFAGTLLIDGVPAEALRRDRPELLRLIAKARKEYAGKLEGAR